MSEQLSDPVKRFTRDLANVRVHASQRAGPSLKKPLLLLLVITKIGRGEIRTNRIYLGQLEDELKKLIHRFGNASPGNENPHLPFFHLRTAPFWKLHLRAAPSRHRHPSLTMLRDEQSYAMLDEELFDSLATSKSNRKKAIQAILTRWWPEGTPKMLEDSLRPES